MKTIKSLMPTAKWLTKVINSCVTQEQLDNASKVTTRWVENQFNEIGWNAVGRKEWSNIQSIGRLLGDEIKTRKQILILNRLGNN